MARVNVLRRRGAAWWPLDGRHGGCIFGVAAERQRQPEKRSSRVTEKPQLNPTTSYTKLLNAHDDYYGCVAAALVAFCCCCCLALASSSCAVCRCVVRSVAQASRCGRAEAPTSFDPNESRRISRSTVYINHTSSDDNEERAMSLLYSDGR